MNIILETNKGANQIIEQKNIEHIKNVLKKSIGDTLRIGFIDGDISLVKILDESLRFEILQSHKSQTPSIHLIVALSRPQTMKKIIEHGTTMGVCEFIFYHAHLSEKSYETSKVLDQENYHELMMAGLSQSGIYTYLPKLSVINKIPDLPTFSGEQFVLSLRDQKKFPTTRNFSDTITLAIGPERGFIPSEEELFLSKGFKPVKLSESILRVEHAVFSAIAQIDYLRMK
jgi:RsmE family RNA methyltransferase